MNEPVGEERPWEHLGRIQLSSGKLLIEDVGFTGRLQEGLVVDLPRETYDIDRKLVVYNGDARNAALRVISPDQVTSRGAQVGEAWTDTAVLGVSDLDRAQSAMADLGDDGLSQEYYKVLEEQEDRADGVIRYQNAELVFFVNSGFGDGTFPVYELASAGGRWGVEVVFIEPGTLYPFTPERMRENNERVWERIRSYSKEPGAESNPTEQ